MDRVLRSRDLEVHQRDADDLEALADLEKEEVDLQEGLESNPDIASRVKDEDGTEQKVLPQLVGTYPTILVGVIQIEIHRGEDAAPHPRLGDQQGHLAPSCELALYGKLRHIRPSAVRVETVTDKETAKDV